MTTASHPWKQLLLRQADALQHLLEPHRWGEASAVKLEETVVLGCYAIQRLINGFLLSDAVVRRPIAMTAFPLRRKQGPLLGDEPIETLYDLAGGHAVAHDLVFLCHQVVHNCIFVPHLDANRCLTGIRATSDHQRRLALYAIDIATLQTLFRQLGA